MHMPIHIAAVIVGLLALSGCSTLKFAYSFAENMVENRAETYLDLSAEQKERLTQQAAVLIAWHRADMLPKYASFFLAQAEIAAAGDDLVYHVILHVLGCNESFREKNIAKRFSLSQKKTLAILQKALAKL